MIYYRLSFITIIFVAAFARSDDRNSNGNSATFFSPSWGLLRDKQPGPGIHCSWTVTESRKFRQFVDQSVTKPAIQAVTVNVTVAVAVTVIVTVVESQSREVRQSVDQSVTRQLLL
jgi:hypothetical protein